LLARRSFRRDTSGPDRVLPRRILHAQIEVTAFDKRVPSMLSPPKEENYASHHHIG
jgi:hypothetical protein